MCLSNTHRKRYCLSITTMFRLMRHNAASYCSIPRNFQFRHKPLPPRLSLHKQCHLQVLTHCYEKRTRNVVPSNRHSPHLCAVTQFSAAVHWISLQSFLDYANTIFYIDLCLGWGKYALWRHSTFTQLGKRLARISIVSQTDSIHIPYNLNRQDQY